MGIPTLFNRYRKSPSYENRCSELAHKLIGKGKIGDIIEITTQDLKDIFFADGHIERYHDRNIPVDDNDLIIRNDELNVCYRQIYEDVIKKIKGILSIKGLRLIEDNGDLKIKRN